MEGSVLAGTSVLRFGGWPCLALSFMTDVNVKTKPIDCTEAHVCFPGLRLRREKTSGRVPSPQSYLAGDGGEEEVIRRIITSWTVGLVNAVALR